MGEWARHDGVMTQVEPGATDWALTFAANANFQHAGVQAVPGRHAEALVGWVDLGTLQHVLGGREAVRLDAFHLHVLHVGQVDRPEERKRDRERERDQHRASFPRRRQIWYLTAYIIWTLFQGRGPEYVRTCQLKNQQSRSFEPSFISFPNLDPKLQSRPSALPVNKALCGYGETRLRTCIGQQQRCRAARSWTAVDGRHCRLSR